jgi:hypothetical protein
VEIITSRVIFELDSVHITVAIFYLGDVLAVPDSVVAIKQSASVTSIGEVSYAARHYLSSKLK